MAKKPVVNKEEFDRLLAEKMAEYEKKHTAWIDLKHGCTYIGYDVQDHVTELLMDSLRKLMELMDIAYCVKHSFGEDKSYYLTLEGEDKARADFIQKFFDNGYRLSWY